MQCDKWAVQVVVEVIQDDGSRGAENLSCLPMCLVNQGGVDGGW